MELTGTQQVEISAMDGDRPDYYPAVSLVLFEILEKIFGQTRETMKQRDDHWALYETLISLISKFSRDVNAVLFGSQTEGSTTPGLQSDMDVVIIDNGFNVTKKNSPFDASYINCQFSTEDTPAGYVRLQCKECDVIKLGTKINIDRHFPFISHQHVEPILSCKYFECLRALLRLYPIYAFQRLDLCYAFQVSISEIDLKHCLSHQRKNAKLLRVLQSEDTMWDSVMVVPVGSPNSFDEFLQWRLSFSMTERRLVTAFNEVQMHCYILLKMVLKCLVEAYVGKVLTSYHLKALMLHMIDSTKEDIWIPENMMFCLERCLNTMTSWVLDGYCPDYFFPENNLFQETVCGPIRFRLAALLSQLLSEKGRFLLRIDCDQIGDRLVLPSMNEDISTQFCRLDQFAFESLTIQTYLHLLQTFLKYTRYNRKFLLLTHLQQMYNYGSPLQKQIFRVLIGNVCSKLDIRDCRRLIASGANKERVQNIALIFLKIGDKVDHIAGSLKLATYHFLCKETFKAIPLLQSVLDKFNYSLLTASVHKHYIRWETVHLLKLYPIRHVLTNCIAYSVIFTENEIEYTPAVLIPEMYRSIVSPGSEGQFWYAWAVVDSKIYAHFLLHQCYMELKFNEAALHVLVELMRTIDRDVTLLHRDTAFNLLAYCLRKMGMTLGAYRCLRHSLLLNGNSDRAASHGHNAAIWHLALLFCRRK